MRKIVVLTFLSLDGVMQAPGGPEEDTAGGFEFGGWTVPYSDEVTGEEVSKQVSQQPFDLLLGRVTYDIFAGYWPKQDDSKFPTSPFNKAVKYVVSNKDINTDWNETVQIKGDVPAELEKLKQQDGPMLQVYGSSILIQTLLENDLVDELWLKIFPITLGKGKRLFSGGSVPAAFTLFESRVSPNGVIIASYRRAGELETGSVE